MKIVVLALGCMLLAACSEERSSSAPYPGPWKDDANFRLVKTLVANKIGGCTELWYRQRAGEDASHAEYLVYCTPDRKMWVAWHAWPSLNKVTGPHDTYPDIAPPRAN
jgi:hypothetical protein